MLIRKKYPFLLQYVASIANPIQMKFTAVVHCSLEVVDCQYISHLTITAELWPFIQYNNGGDVSAQCKMYGCANCSHSCLWTSLDFVWLINTAQQATVIHSLHFHSLCTNSAWQLLSCMPLIDSGTLWWQSWWQTDRAAYFFNKTFLQLINIPNLHCVQISLHNYRYSVGKHFKHAFCSKDHTIVICHKQFTQHGSLKS